MEKIEFDKIVIKDLLKDKNKLKNEIDETLDHIVGEAHLLKDYSSMSVKFFDKKARKIINEIQNILDILKNNSKNII